MAASSSSSPCLEGMEAMNNPYQFNTFPGPKGAFEARKVKGGFYVRVDMPGVGPDGLKIKKYSDTHTVTFSGKAPIVWEEIESSDRVYGGYVVLDRNPLELDIAVDLNKGCLRMFFPGADGSLHRLTSKKSTTLQPTPIDEDSPYRDYDPIGYYALFDNMNPSLDQKARDYLKLYRELHAQEKISYQPPTPDQGRGISGGNFVHINPFLLSGVEGVYDHRVVRGDFGGQDDNVIYVRLDMPGIDESNYWAKVINKGTQQISFGGNGRNESRYDMGGRKYIASFAQRCKCCRYFVVRELLQDGVLRLLCHKARIKNQSKKKC